MRLELSSICCLAPHNNSQTNIMANQAGAKHSAWASIVVSVSVTVKHCIEHWTCPLGRFWMSPKIRVAKCLFYFLANCFVVFLVQRAMERQPRKVQEKWRLTKNKWVKFLENSCDLVVVCLCLRFLADNKELNESFRPYKCKLLVQTMRRMIDVRRCQRVCEHANWKRNE